LPDGALAPPVGLDSPVPLEPLSVEAFSFSSAEVPPAAPDPLELSLLEDSPASPLLVSPLEDSEEEPSPVVLVDLVDVVEVEVV
jgi:hypothetical protein